MPDDVKPNKTAHATQDTADNKQRPHSANHKRRYNKYRNNDRQGSTYNNNTSAPRHSTSETVSIFEKEATLHSTKANYWRKRVNGFSAFALIFATIALTLNMMVGDTQFIAGFALTFFTLSFLMVYAAYNYSQHKKAAALNKYRHNILMTANDMAQNTKDTITKEEIMLEALAAIGGGDKN